ncbi:MAG: hypothetical protein AAFV69_15870, partial [Pseudomonadota bacterium]
MVVRTNCEAVGLNGVGSCQPPRLIVSVGACHQVRRNLVAGHSPLKHRYALVQGGDYLAGTTP